MHDEVDGHAGDGRADGEPRERSGPHDGRVEGDAHLAGLPGHVAGGDGRRDYHVGRQESWSGNFSQDGCGLLLFPHASRDGIGGFIFLVEG